MYADCSADLAPPSEETLKRRGRTALKRSAPSRPVRLALENSLVRSNDTVLDYGCGHGVDVRFLTASQIEARGFDPVHGPFEPPDPADVVNLGYVVNVIEAAQERVEVLRKAWDLTGRTLIVSARLENESNIEQPTCSGDGYTTRIGTFQKLYSHAELGAWIRSALQARTEALGPGIYCVFRHDIDADQYEANRFRRVYLPRIDHKETFLAQHREVVAELLEFARKRGRLPVADELKDSLPLVEAFGSVRRALAAFRRCLNDEQWEQAERARTEDVLITLALARFSRRPKLNELSTELKADVRTFFTSYAAACELADELLFAVGNGDIIRQACRRSLLGKMTPKALYVHRDWLDRLSPVLRLYEGCARAWLGQVNAEIIKLHHEQAAISYLSYPTFDTDPHPRLQSSVTVGLKRQSLQVLSFEGRSATPILHRKECFLHTDDQRFARFSRLTRQEERAGLYETPAKIGISTYWENLLHEKGLGFHGHRLVRREKIALSSHTNC